MKPAATLRELLKPPFCDEFSNEDIYCVTKFGCTRVLEICGFRYFHNPEVPEIGKYLQDEFKKFVIQALNEKWERDFGEPLRWGVDKEPYSSDGKFKDFIYYCPKCRIIRENFYDCCSSCG